MWLASASRRIAERAHALLPRICQQYGQRIAVVLVTISVLRIIDSPDFGQ
jgi:hypothetical protein